MSALGLIFSNIHDSNVPELTAKRTVASIPFGGRYRLIDFALSDMVNSDVSKVGVITKSNYRSLMDHIGSGKDWDLARHHGGLFILPPFDNQGASLYTTRLEALKNVLGFIAHSTEEYVIMSDSDMVTNIDFKPVMKEHLRNNADITLVYVKKDRSELGGKMNTVFDLDGDRIVSAAFDSKEKTVNVYTNICIIGRVLLINLIQEALSHGSSHFVKDVILPHISTLRVYGHEHIGYYEEITSLQKYFVESMKFLNRETRDEVFRKADVYTKVKDSTPTHYGNGSITKNSLIADGCTIEGEVYDSIVFRGVKVAKGAVVKNCILMQNTIIGENANLNCIITDKNTIVRDKRNLSGCETHPFFIGKGSVI